MEKREREMPGNGGRIAYLDAVKVIALALVFALHTQRGVEVTDPCHNFIFFYAARCSMPLFFMVNGALILNKKSLTRAWYMKKLFNTVRILFIWGIVTIGYYLIYMREGLFEAVKNGLKVMLAYHWVINLWFLVTFMLIYTVLLFSFDAVKKHIHAVTGILGAVCVCIDLLSMINISKGGFFIQDAVNQRLRLWTWMFYFCLGYELSQVRLPEKTGEEWMSAELSATIPVSEWKVLPYTVLRMTAVMTLAGTAWQYYVCWGKTGQIESNYMYDSIVIILWCACVFLLFRVSDRVSRFFAKFIGPSFGAFLLHSYFIDALNLRAVPKTHGQAFLIWACLVAGCWILSYLLGKVPYVRRMLAY